MVSQRRPNRISACPLTAALAAVGGKWKLIIIYSLAEQPYHFSAIREFLGDVSPKVLSEQLGELIADHIVQRDETGPVPARVMYSLTEYGYSVLPLVGVLRDWGKQHIERFTLEPAT
jgi:DNA-binding HxlR family transcriptional regulator